MDTRYQHSFSRSKGLSYHESGRDTNDDAVRQAILAVVQVWLNRLHLISTITTFFASIDALLFSLASAATHVGERTYTGWSPIDQLTSASLAGALIFHVCSAIVAFVGSFVLIRLQLIDADQHAHEQVDVVESDPYTNFPRRSEKLRKSRGHKHRPSGSGATLTELPAGPYIGPFTAPLADVYDNIFRRVIVRRTHPLYFLSRRQHPRPRPAPLSTCEPSDTLDPPVRLLERYLMLSVIMATVGFALAVLGVLAYAWKTTPKSVSVFSTVCLGGCLLAGIIAAW
ncbi:hypothetical protein AcV5_002069 [Taiwanofungus camphoratus]|nr:hypothetical protein AcV5_002069 [Antrodia cinnamomea]